MPQSVLEQVVVVAPLQESHQAAAEAGSETVRPRQGERDLKVDQMGSSVVIDENVFPLVEIDVGHATAMGLRQERGKTREELVVYSLFFRERMPLDPRRRIPPTSRA